MRNTYRSTRNDQDNTSANNARGGWRFAPEEETPEPVAEQHAPNTFSLWERASNTFLALALLAYGAHGLLRDDLYLPGRRSRGVHLHGTPAWIMYGAFVCAAAVLLALVVDHYDRRNNEHHYDRFKQLVGKAGWGFFFAALLWDLVAHVMR